MRRIRERPAVAFATMSALAIAAIVVGELIVNGTDIGEWDVLFDSAWLAVIAGLWLARGLPGRFAAMIERLANRGALVRNGQPVTRADIAVVEAELADEARGAEQRWGIVIGVLIALSFVAAKSSVLPAHPALGDVLVSVVGAAALGAVGGFLAGRVIGRMLCYSTLGRSLERRDISFQASPGHVDGAAGLRPLGDYFLRQSLLLAIPAVFLLVWSLLLLSPALHDYARWRAPYLVLLAVAICLEWAGFGAPLRRAHRAMIRDKSVALVTADAVLGPEIARARRELELDLDADRRAAVRERLEQLSNSYREIDEMPTWPLDRSLRRRATLANVAIVVPLALQVSAAAGNALSG